MGYPMTWSRVIHRNSLTGNYTNSPLVYPEQEAQRVRLISGDLRRVEQDSVDGEYATQAIANRAGVDIETVQKVLKAFFHGAPNILPHDEVKS